MQARKGGERRRKGEGETLRKEKKRGEKTEKPRNIS